MTNDTTKYGGWYAGDHVSLAGKFLLLVNTGKLVQWRDSVIELFGGKSDNVRKSFLKFSSVSHVATASYDKKDYVVVLSGIYVYVYDHNFRVKTRKLVEPKGRFILEIHENLVIYKTFSKFKFTSIVIDIRTGATVRPIVEKSQEITRYLFDDFEYANNREYNKVSKNYAYYSTERKKSIIRYDKCGNNSKVFDCDFNNLYLAVGDKLVMYQCMSCNTTYDVDVDTPSYYHTYISITNEDFSPLIQIILKSSGSCMNLVRLGDDVFAIIALLRNSCKVYVCESVNAFRPVYFGDYGEDAAIIYRNSSLVITDKTRTHIYKNCYDSTTFHPSLLRACVRLAGLWLPNEMFGEIESHFY